MQYLGGKTRIAKQLAAEVDKVRRPGQWVWDAFCGGLSMSVALSKNGPVYSTDACVPLIGLYRAVQAGWDPPTHVDEATYRAARNLPDTDPMKAFCGFGCSFGGRFFEGYARGGCRSYADTTRRVLHAQIPVCSEFAAVDFFDVHPRPLDGVLYLDPPYAGTKSYSRTPRLDHARFVERVREWSAFAPVFVSEYEFSLGQVVLAIRKAKSVAGGNGGGRVGIERLYYIAKGSL